MNLAVPTSWDDALLESLSKINTLSINKLELYGSLPQSLTGSARPFISLPIINFEEAKKHINLAHSLGFTFNYLLNAPCIGGIEYNKEYMKAIMSYIDKVISELNVDILTISIPLIIEEVKRKYPSIMIKASTEVRIDNIFSAKFYEELGVSRICLDSSINRDFKILKDIINSVNCKVEVIVNESCLLKCPLRIYHGLLMGHSSQKYFKKKHSCIFKYPILDYPSLKCIAKKLDSLEELIKAPWIRPEDCEAYEAMGISHFKISGRTKPTKWILRCAEAYLKREYKGNLLDLLDAPRPLKKNHVYKLPFYIPNNELNGFLNFFRDLQCTYLCDKCDYCKEVSRRIIKVKSEKELAEYQRLIKNSLKKFFISRGIF